MTSPKTQAFAKDVLNHMRERLSDYQEMYGDLYNLEATPAESTSYRLAKHDVKRYPGIITASKETPYYTNSSHLPVGYTEDIFEALDIQDELQTLYTSGTVFHAFLGEKLPDWRAAADLVRKIANNYKLPYYTLSPTYSVCRNHGYIAGEEFKCPTAAPPPRSTAVSQATIAPSKTGTTARLRNTKSAKSIISLTHTLRVTVITPLAPARSVKRLPALSPTDLSLQDCDLPQLQSSSRSARQGRHLGQ